MCAGINPLALGALGMLAYQEFSARSLERETARKDSWEKQFKSWRSPPSDSEAERIARTERMIKEAIANDSALSRLDLSVILQGSYSNNTNIRGESDIDICVLMRDTIHRDIKPPFFGSFHYNTIAVSPIVHSPSSLKDKLARALITKFESDTVTRTNKCIKIRSNTARVEADVVPAIPNLVYLPGAFQDVTASTPFREGIAIFPDQGGPIFNWPQQHGDNGRQKNNLTRGRFKDVVRILKTLNLELASPTNKAVPSFLIECLTYNCPDHCFAHETLLGNVEACLTYMGALGAGLASTDGWFEINLIKPLFSGSQAWSLDDATRFRDAVSQRLRAPF